MIDVTVNIRFLRVLAPLLTLTALACDEAETDFDQESVRASDLADEVCPAGRQIARKVSNVCPVIPDWSATPLFEGGPGALGSFCSYTWTGLPGQEDDAALVNHPSLAAVGSDCEVVFEQGVSVDALWAQLDPDILALFRHATGRAKPIDLALKSSEASRWPVSVAVLDSVPQPGPANPTSEHGEIMVSMVEDVACPSPLADCAVSVRRGLALPRVSLGQVDLVHGGFFGSQGDAAQSIYAAVETWRTTNWGPQTPNLILSQSFGWEPEFGAVAVDSPAVAAVHTALEYASCHGAIIIAAAGNQGHLCSSGALLPAAWEQQSAPNAARCAALGAPAPTPGNPYRPLLYSVGGLDHELGPMPGSRVDGMPRLASSATHAPSRGDSTSVTGTSAAAATVAGAAALVWSYNPNMVASQVMATLYESGTNTGMVADYVGPVTNLTDVHKLDVCAALDLACDKPGSSCPAVPFANPLACIAAPPPVTLTDLFDEIAALIPDPNYTVTRNFGPAQQCDAACGFAGRTGYFATSAGACPTPILPAMPFTEPQPTEVACPNCTLDVASNIVYASLDPSYAGATLRDVSVDVFDGSQYYYFDLGPIPLTPAAITTIQLPVAAPMPGTIVSSTISMTFLEYPRPVVDDLLVH